MFKIKKKKENESVGTGNFAEVEKTDVSESDNDPVENDAEDNDDSQISPSTSLRENFLEWVKDRGLDEDSKEDILKIIRQIEMSVTDGAIDESVFEILIKGVSYDQSVAEAAEAGEIKGRNARIEELIESGQEGDGVPHPVGGGSFSAGRRPSIFDLARDAY